MKKIIIPFITFLLIFLTIPFAFAASKATVNTEAIRVREKASVDSDIVTVLYKDDECEIIETSGEWSKIKYGDYTGYVKKEYLQTSDKTSETQNSSDSNLEKNVNNTLENTETTATASTQTNVDNTSISSNTEQDIVNDSVNTIENNTQVVENNQDLNNQEITIGSEYTITKDTFLRSLPSIISQEKINIIQGTSVNVKSNVNNWYQISSSVGEGWITKEKLSSAIMPTLAETQQDENNLNQTVESSQTENSDSAQISEEKESTTESASQAETTGKTGYINVDTARVRSLASTSSDIAGTLDEDSEVTILGEEGNFYKIKSDSVSGYISKDLVTLKSVSSRGTTEAREKVNDVVSDEANNAVNSALSNNTDPEENVSNSASGQSVVEFAKQYLGYPYVSGASSPEAGFDCSGFTRYVFSNFGITLGRVAADQKDNGTEVSRENLVAGDLILFYDDGMTKIGHVGIYIGSGNFVHSANPKRGVVIDNLNTSTYYNTRYVTARRLL